MIVEDEVAIIYCGTRGLLENVPVDKVSEFEKSLLQLLHSAHQTDVMDQLREGKLTEEMGQKLNAAAVQVAASY